MDWDEMNELEKNERAKKAKKITTELVKINNKEVQILEYKGHRVLTHSMIDHLHERVEGSARKRFSDNQDRFEEGKHIFKVLRAEKRALGIDIPNRGLNLFTMKGYLLLVKSFSDDLAWKVQEELIDGYFRLKPQAKPSNLQLLKMGVEAEERNLALELKVQEQSLIVQEQSLIVQEQAPLADAAKRIAMCEGDLTLRNAAGTLQVREIELINYLKLHHWIFRDAGNQEWRGYAERRHEQGVLIHKVTPFVDKNGIDRTSVQVRVTPKGLVVLATIIRKNPDWFIPNSPHLIHDLPLLIRKGSSRAPGQSL